MKNETKKKKSNNTAVKNICFTGIMAALVFVFTFTFKVPLGQGYVHLGDSMIFLAIVLLGTKKSVFAAGIGASLADLAGGYAVWMLPTLVIKSVMALICGLVAEKLFKNKNFGYAAGCIAGGAFQICGYLTADAVLYGKAYAVSDIIPLMLQTAFGIVIALVLIFIFNKSNVTEKLKRLTK